MKFTEIAITANGGEGEVGGGVSAVRGSLKCHKREEFDASLDPEICSCVEEQSVYLN